MTDLSIAQKLTEYKPANKVRFITAASLFDGHDASINIMRRILMANGAEVVHLGHNRSVDDIVTAALQDNGRAKIVGEKTYGKGVANSPEKLSNDAQLNVTVIEWLTPKRNSIFKKGITPDYPVADTRFEKLLAFEGVNAKPGSKLEVKVNGQTLQLVADKEGRFQYQQSPTRLKSSTTQGQATVDLAKDAQLRKALELLSAK